LLVLEIRVAGCWLLVATFHYRCLIVYPQTLLVLQTKTACVILFVFASRANIRLNIIKVFL